MPIWKGKKKRLRLKNPAKRKSRSTIFSLKNQRLSIIRLKYRGWPGRPSHVLSIDRRLARSIYRLWPRNEFWAIYQAKERFYSSNRPPGMNAREWYLHDSFKSHCCKCSEELIRLFKSMESPKYRGDINVLLCGDLSCERRHFSFGHAKKEYVTQPLQPHNTNTIYNQLQYV